MRFVKGSHRWGRLFYPRVFIDGADFNTDDAGLEPVPDINAHPQDYDILAWNLEPGDVIAFDFRTLHGTTAGKVQGRRRALSTRWLGDDVTYCRRPGETSPPFPEIGLEEGERMREDWVSGRVAEGRRVRRFSPRVRRAGARNWSDSTPVTPLQRHCALEILIEQRHGESGVAMRGAVHHPLADQLRPGRGHRAHRLAELPRDLAGAMEAAPELGHCPQILLLRRGQTVEPNSEEARIELGDGLACSGYHFDGGDG